MVWLEYDGPAPGKKWDNGGIVVEGLNVMVGSSWVVMGCVVLVGVTCWSMVGSVVFGGIVVLGEGWVDVGINDEVDSPVVGGGGGGSRSMYLSGVIGVIGVVGELLIVFSLSKILFARKVRSISGSNANGDSLWELLVRMHL